MHRILVLTQASVPEKEQKVQPLQIHFFPPVWRSSSFILCSLRVGLPQKGEDTRNQIHSDKTHGDCQAGLCWLIGHSETKKFDEESEERMDLIVEGKGLFIGKHQGRICIYRQQKAIQETPLIHLKQIIVVDSGVGISSDVVRVCSEEGIPIHFISRRGETLAGLYATGLNGTILTRRAQLLAYTTPVGVAVSKAIVRGKIANQASLLRYCANARKEAL